MSNPMSDLVERVARLLDPLAWDVDGEDEMPRLFRTTLEGRRNKARRDARAAIAEVRAADVERGATVAETMAASELIYGPHHIQRHLEVSQRALEAAAKVRQEQAE